MTSDVSEWSNLTLNKLKSLPIEQQQQVFDFIEFLASKYQTSQAITTKQSRVMGLFEGKGRISDDFNEPLPDEFWFGQL
jgi:Protein of unknown function (DUF2281)